MKQIITISVFLALACAAAGCTDHNSSASGGSATGGKLLADHMAPQRKEKAHQHWDSVRAEVKLQLAKQHLAVGRLDEAEKVLDQAMSMVPKDPQAYLLLTRLRLEQGRLAEAREAISAALSLPPSAGASESARAADPEIPYFAGIVAQRYNDLELAANYYMVAARIAPNVAGYVLAHAETLVALDQPMDALDLLERRMNDFDNSAPMRILAARVCRMLGLRGPAAVYAREAVRLDPDDILASEAGQILVWAERFGEAVSVLAPLVESGGSTGIRQAQTSHPASAQNRIPVDSSVRRCLATAYFRSGRADQAMKTLAPAFGGDSVETATCTLYARAALAAGDLSAAAQAIEKAVRLSAHDEAQEHGAATSETMLLAAFIAFHKGDFTSAMERVDQAIRRDRSVVAAYFLKGQTAEATGRIDEARRAYADALTIDPGSQTAAALLARLTPSYRCEDPFGKTAVTDPLSPGRADGRQSP